MSFQVKIVRFRANAKIPTYATKGDAGADLYSVEKVYIEAKERALVRTGIVIEIPYGWVGLVHPRSGLAHKYGVTVSNAPGTIDSGYRGEIMVNLINHGNAGFAVNVGDRIAQIVFQQVEFAEFVEEGALTDSIRGEGGHGSTGGFNG